jgi:hypothetical protein
MSPSAVSTPGASVVRLRGRTVGVPVRLRDASTMDELGVVHAPPPAEPEDVVGLEHGPLLRVVAVLVPVGSAVVPALVSRESASAAISDNVP